MTLNYCSDCGHKLVSEANFCINCGKRIAENNKGKEQVHEPNSDNLVQPNVPKSTHKPSVSNAIHRLNVSVRKNPIVSIVIAVVVTVLLVVSLVDSPKEAAEKTKKSNEEHALEAAEESVKNQIEIDGFSYVKVKDMQANMTREENLNTQQSGIFKVVGTAVLKDTKGKKHDDVPFQLYVDFYDGEYYAQQMVDIRYGYPLIEQLR